MRRTSHLDGRTHPPQVTIDAFSHANTIEVLEQRHRNTARRPEHLSRSRERERLRQPPEPFGRHHRRSGEQSDIPRQEQDRPRRCSRSELTPPEPQRHELLLLRGGERRVRECSSES